MTDVKVEQCDRVAAASLEGVHCLTGDFDSHSVVQAFARHRQAAEKAQQERDAGIVDGYSKQFAETLKQKDMSVALLSSVVPLSQLADYIATAIRSQGHE